MRKVLGVSLGRKSAGIALVESRLGAVRPVKTETVQLSGSDEERSAAVSEALKRWKHACSPDGLVLGVDLRHFSHQLVEMPAMSRDDMRRALTFDLEKHLPLPVDEYVFDFIAFPAQKGRMKVLVFSLKRDFIDSLSSAAREAGLRILAVRSGTVEAFCSLLEIVDKKKRDGLFVNITDQSYEVVGMKNALPVYLKNIPKTTDPTAEIERLKAVYPGEVFLNGDLDPETAGRVAGKRIQIPLPHAIARSGVKKGPLSMDFLPVELAASGRDWYPYLIGGIACAALTLFLLTGVVSYIKELKALQAVESRLDVIRKQASGVLAARKRMEGLGKDRRVIRDFMSKSNIATQALRDLSETLPPDTWLINVSADDKGRVEIEGLTPKTSAVVTALEKSPAFRNVAFSAPIISREGEERFALRMELEGR